MDHVLFVSSVSRGRFGFLTPSVLGGRDSAPTTYIGTWNVSQRNLQSFRSSESEKHNTVGKRDQGIGDMAGGLVAPPGLVQTRLAQHGILVTLQ